MEFRAIVMLLTALIGLAVPADRVAAAPAVMHLAADTEARWVSFELTAGNQIRFRTLLNGRWVDALLDTGVTDSAVSTRFAHTAGLKPLVAGRADAIGGSVALSWTGIDRVEVGGLVRTGGRVAIIDADPRVTGNAPVDLFVGSDLLAGHALEIDYDTQRFRLLPSGRMPFRGVTLPLRLAERSGLYLSELDLGGRNVRPVIVDTGDGGMVSLTRSFWQASASAAVPTTTAISWGLGGVVESEVAILPALRIGGLAAEVELRVEPDTGFSGRKGAAGRIGGGLLRRHRVLLDPRAGRMVLATGARADWPVTRSTSGLMVTQERDQLRVLHVMRGSPAAAMGWRAGTLICAVDGMPAADAARDWATGVPGRRVRLTLCEGGERSLTLARFY
ncbi:MULTISPECIES: aspartyl protease family protein [unclassified Sphingomonas]|uniref:aspartyl protease family protein n=1 Tax=unclassified Sphingomonas TaxID=196159 RepID=UPI002151F070|nr:MULTISPECIES: aspartyl protease family protein [unclassified Sphingomonas]MCR5869747.1 aspartyl protease family protein [Sphingomonas sp. J344]UUX98550.1 aspartyl protease family protein [Sphingomonas sp. J315]